ncbi:4'-phosphopantetheinyl transferase superfamily protein [Streptomyces sp. NPDC031705]|uniref:4'-phosphopantetheinyl transferase family protein n=1 Tax=Streptomyces sp. NPDC031705 TaxID=3155729 RepID=UPI0033F1D8E1
MIEKLVPAPGVASAEAFGDTARTPLLGAESEIVSNAVEKRRQEFATVRRCAREALADLGIAPVPILTGERGAPVWPEGVIGSMTHCKGYRAAAVTRSSDILTVGIDAEPHLPLPKGMLDLIALPAERRRTAELSRLEPEVHWDRLLFCMKECVYKAWFPIARRVLDFGHAEITIDYDGTFSARLLKTDPAFPGNLWSGRWLIDQDLIVAGITVPA